MCLYPKFVLNRKYTPNKKNQGNIPELKDSRTLYVPVGCGKCMECMKKKARGWQVRLHEDIRNNVRNAKFVTLSFSDKSLIELEKALDDELNGYLLDNKIATLAVRRFLERWRKTFKTSIKHWLVTELGQENTERIHLHGILYTDEPKETIEKYWAYGNVWIGNYVNERTINYIVKYIHKADQKHKYYTPIILCSKGIGNNYLSRSDSSKNRYVEKNTDELYTTRTGIKLPLPIYYRNKIYSDEEREMLWLEMLDKNVRYVNKIKIDVSENELDYFNVLRDARLKNERLGYGNDEIDWDKKRYEQQCRNLKRLQRLSKENGRSG